MGVKRDRFLSLLQLDRAMGEDLVSKIVRELEDVMPHNWELSRHLVAVGCDGASVMLGENRGVAGILKAKHAPFVTAIHCAAHKVCYHKRGCFPFKPFGV